MSGEQGPGCEGKGDNAHRLVFIQREKLVVGHGTLHFYLLLKGIVKIVNKTKSSLWSVFLYSILSEEIGFETALL